ncbi:unnamed protein product [Effrenium voratum]|nr:unnamed protein product [Effrenium voratum]
MRLPGKATGKAGRRDLQAILRAWSAETRRIHSRSAWRGRGSLISLQRRGGDAGDRAPMEKAIGGREDAMELLQSILPNTRINVAQPPAGNPLQAGAFRHLGCGYEVPPNPYGLGVGDPRLNPALGDRWACMAPFIQI